MKLGRLDVCLRVASIAASREFYERLGLVRVEGDDAAGWAVMAGNGVRIGLFLPQFMASDALSLNFRGANIRQLSTELDAQGMVTEGPPRFVGARGGSLKLRDPDGNLLFFDSEDLPQE